MAEPTVVHLSIGEVLGLLLEEFPDVTISKIRFLESQGLIEPERTPSGYRKFYEADVQLLRLILREQREHFLPLRVIKDRIDSGEIEPANGAQPHGTETSHPADGHNAPAPDEVPTSAMANHPASGGRGAAAFGSDGTRGHPAIRESRHAADQLAPTPPSMPRPGHASEQPSAVSSPRLLPGVVLNRDELCAMASITAEQLASLEEYGVIQHGKGAGEIYGEEAVEIASAAGGFLRAGVDARHLRAWRTSIEREVGLYEQLIVPMLRQRHPQARAQAMELLDELNGLSTRLRGALTRATVKQNLDL